MQSLASRVSDTEVRAPLDGVVLAKSVELGEVVVVNQPLFKVGDVTRLILEVSVDEADIGRVRRWARRPLRLGRSRSASMRFRSRFSKATCSRCCPTPTAIERHFS